jgi:hypothetical protein
VCQAVPNQFNANPNAKLVSLGKAAQAILFTSRTDGASGYRIHYALLQQNANGKLDNLFGASGLETSNQSQHKFFEDSSLSDTPLFVTAEYDWGVTEAR